MIVILRQNAEQARIDALMASIRAQGVDIHYLSLIHI